MKILMRATVDPLTDMTPSKFIIENHTGGNIGNMMFTNSIVKTLMVDDDTTIDYINTQTAKLNKKYADFVNENYQFFLIPMANAFKNNGHEELTKLADFVRMLNIPCAVLGIGIQRALVPGKYSEIYRYNDEAKEFISAILEKSPMIGVRGEMTADYLGELGFFPEKDYTVIGCPSMFTYGAKLPTLKKTILTPESIVAFNSKVEHESNPGYAFMADPYKAFLEKSYPMFPNMLYTVQQIDDARMIYLDSLMQERREDKMYDVSKAITFTGVNAWIDFFREQVDFSFGARIHGSIAAVLAGVPTLTAPLDRRVYELADYHNIPTVTFNHLYKHTDETLFDLFEKADFESVYRGHEERFGHYLDFLHSIGLETIYDSEYEGEYPYDKIQKNSGGAVIKAYDSISESEKTERYKESFELFHEKYLDRRERDRAKGKQISELKKEKNALNKKIKRLEYEQKHPIKTFIKKVLRKLGLKK